jgi:heptosyltransferase III
MTKIKNLLLVRTDRIGDVVLALPMARIIKKHYPDCKVSIFLREYTKPLAENNPFIDEVIILKTKNGSPLCRENIKQLKSKNFDSCVIANPDFAISIILFFSKIRIRVGTGYRLYSFLFNRRVYEHRKYGEKHELEYNINLLSKIGIDETINFENVKFDLAVIDNDLEKIKSLLSQYGITSRDRKVIFHPGSGGSAVDLPLNKMIELNTQLTKIENVKILLTGTKDESKLCESLVISENVYNLAGKFNLGELCALISLCDLFISNSTGPIHIAAALNKFTIGFYPKILSCSQKRWGPYTEKKAIYTPTIDCINCNREQCEKLDCMNSIDIGKVFEQAKQVLYQ